MTLQKRYSAPIIASIMVITLAIGLSLQDSTAQISLEESEFDYRNSAINGMQIRTTFHFEGIGDNTLETFSVYKQLSGFKKNEIGSFSLAGLAGIDKIGLYKLADLSTNQRAGSEQHPVNNFHVDVQIIQKDIVLHEFKYSSCKMSDYRVDTLFDADETFSGKTKFAIVDVFEFTCRGFQPNTPLFDEIVGKIAKANTTSTMDLSPGMTWESHPKYGRSGFVVP